MLAQAVRDELAPGVLSAVHLCAVVINIALRARIVGLATSRHFPSVSLRLCYRCFCSAVNGRTRLEIGVRPIALSGALNWLRTEGNSIVGILRTIWPPLLAYGTIPVRLPFGIFALRIIFTRYIRESGQRADRHGRPSVLDCGDRHGQTAVQPCRKRYWLIMVAVECLTALGILIATPGRLGLQPTNVL